MFIGWLDDVGKRFESYGILGNTIWSLVVIFVGNKLVICLSRSLEGWGLVGDFFFIFFSVDDFFSLFFFCLILICIFRVRCKILVFCCRICCRCCCCCCCFSWCWVFRNNCVCVFFCSFFLIFCSLWSICCFFRICFFLVVELLLSFLVIILLIMVLSFLLVFIFSVLLDRLFMFLYCGGVGVSFLYWGVVVGGGGGGGMLEVLFGLFVLFLLLLLWFFFFFGFGRFFYIWFGFFGGKFEFFLLVDFIIFCVIKIEKKNFIIKWFINKCFNNLF